MCVYYIVWFRFIFKNEALKGRHMVAMNENFKLNKQIEKMHQEVHKFSIKFIYIRSRVFKYKSMILCSLDYVKKDNFSFESKMSNQIAILSYSYSYFSFNLGCHLSFSWILEKLKNGKTSESFIKVIKMLFKYLRFFLGIR